MKYISLFITVVLLSFSLYSQEVIATQGGVQSNTNASLEYTIGEVVIQTQSSINNDLTQGFHQTTLVVTPIDNPFPEIEVNIYPNPMTEQLFIKTNAYKNLTFSIYDEKGRIVIEEILESELTQVQVDFLANGQYFLVLKNDSQKLTIQTFKLIKAL
jgi:hypothetical protein